MKKDEEVRRHLSVEGCVVPRRFRDRIIAETALECLRLNLRGMFVSWEGRSVGRIEGVEINDKGVRAKVKLLRSLKRFRRGLELVGRLPAFGVNESRKEVGL